MAVVLRLMRAGAKKRPSYRIVAADSRRQRDGRFLEILGHYNPIPETFELSLDKEKIARWLAHGAQPSTQVASLLKRDGMDLYKPSKPKKKAEKAAAPKAEKPRKAAPKKASERKTRAKAARKAGPKPAAKAAPKKT